MTAKIRLSATSEESNNWVTLFKALESANVIKLLEISDNYQNRGDSQYQRVYLEADLLVDIEAVARGVINPAIVRIKFLAVVKQRR